MPHLLAVVADAHRPGEEGLRREVAERASGPLLERRARTWTVLVDAPHVLVGSALPDVEHLRQLRVTRRDGVTAVVEGYLVGGRASAATGEASDCVAEAYLERGPEGVEALNGSFLAMIVDERARRVLVWTDRTGSIPCYVAKVSGATVVAPELKCLAALPEVDHTMVPGSLASMAVNAALIDDHAYWQGVEVVGPARRVTIEAGRCETVRTWTPRYGGDDSQPPPAAEEFRDTLVRAVTRHAGRFDRPVLALSGGVDSRVLLGAMRRAGLSFPIVTWGFDRLDMPGSDFQRGIELAAREGLQHHTRPIEIEQMPDHAEHIVWLTDGLTGHVGNFPEGEAMGRYLAGLGDAVIVGNQASGRCGGVRSLEGALKSGAGLNLRKRLGVLRFLLRGEVVETVMADYRRQLDRLIGGLSDMRAAELGDALVLYTWFSTTIISQARVTRQHINYVSPLMDAEVIDLKTRCPAPYRVKKNYLCQAGREQFPDQFAIDLNIKHSRGNWQKRLRELSRASRYMVETLLDPQEAFDEWFDRGAMHAWLADTTAEGKRAAAPAGVSLGRRAWLRLGALARRYDFKHRMVQNLLTLKLWFGRFPSR